MSNRKSSYKLIIFAFAIFFVSFAASTASAQNVIVNPGAASYPDLTSAFNAINAGTHTGAVTVDIVNSTAEPANTSAVLNSSGAGAASYTSVIIRPANDGITVTGAGGAAGTCGGKGLIEFNGADNVTLDGDNPNTGGTNRNLTLTDTCIGTYASVVRIALAATIVTSADNVIIKNLIINGSAPGRNISTATSTTGTENTTYGILATGGASTVAATTAPSSISSTTTTIGTGATANNLTIQNNSITSCARGVAVQGSATTVFPGLLIENSNIGNSTAAAVDQVYSMGITIQGSTNAIVRKNTVYVESFIATANRGIEFGSISASGSGATFEKNNVARVFNNNSGSYGAYGLNLGGGNSHVVRNNFISNVHNDQTAGTGALSTTFGAFGLRILTGTGHLINNNSVHLSGVLPGTVSTDLVAAVGVVSTASTGMDIRNNIFSNQMTGGNPTQTNTRLVSVYFVTGATVSMNLTWNNNDYFSGTDVNSRLAQVGTTPGTGEYTAANFDPTTTAPATNFRAYTSPLSAAGTNDNASIKVDPSFISTTDLHVSGVSSVLNLGATIGSVTDDIDGDTRPLEGAYEIGADERLTVVSPGQIQLSAATNAGNEGTSVAITATRTAGVTGAVSVTYAMVNVTATGGGACGGAVDYVNTGGSFNWAAGVGGSQVVNVPLCTDAALDPAETFTFTISAPTGGATLGAPTSSTVTITDVPPPFSGTYTAGSGGTYSSITNAGGLFEAINLAGATGNITVNLVGDATGETGAVALNEIAGGFSVLIKPSGAARTITGSAATSLIRLAGADNVTIDGSTSGSTDKSLTISNTNTSGAVIHFLNASTGNTVKNSILQGVSTSTTNGVVFISTSATGVVGNSNNTIQNNDIRGGATAQVYGVYNSGTAAAKNAANLVTKNRIFDFSNTGIYDNGNSAGAVYSENYIFEVTTQATDLTGFRLSATTIDGATFTRNSIRDLNTTSTGTVIGVYLFDTNGTAATPEISNNLITLSPATALTVRGIYDLTATGEKYNVYYNTVYIGGTVTGVSNSWAYHRSIASTTDLRDNILFNARTGGTGKHYSIQTTTPLTSLTSDFNDIFNSGGTANVFGNDGTADRADLAAWKLATAKDANSISADPLFRSTTDVRITATSPARNVGTPIAGITVDFDNQPRPNPTDAFVVQVDIGGDEFLAPTAAEISISGRVTTASGQGIKNAIMSIQGGNLPSPIFVRTASLGYYTVEGLTAGETYIVTVNSKRFIFQVPNRVISATDSVNDVDFAADPQ